MTMFLTRTTDPNGVHTYVISDDGRIVAHLAAEQMASIAADYGRMIAEDRSKEAAKREAEEKRADHEARVAAQRRVTVDGEDWIVQRHWGYGQDHDIAAWPATYDSKDKAPFVVQVDGFKKALQWTIEAERDPYYAHLRKRLCGPSGKTRRFATIETAIRAVQQHVKVTTE